MKEYAKDFYKSRKWQKISRLYMERKNYVCERCGQLASICHHRIHLTPLNIHDTKISLSSDNLEALCQKCHNKEHGYFKIGESKKCNAIFDENGEMIGMRESEEVKNFEQSKRLIEKIPPLSNEKNDTIVDRAYPRNSSLKNTQAR